MIRNRWFLLLFILATLFMSAMPQTGYACSPGSDPDYRIESQNSQFLYLSFAETRALPGPFLSELYNKYKRTGLYRNDGSTEMLWTAGMVSREAVITNDGRHLIDFGNGEQGVTFYEAGRKLKSYSLADFGISWKGDGPFCFGTYRKADKTTVAKSFRVNPVWTSIGLDNGAGRLSIDSFAFETYTFDLNGNLLEQHDNFDWSTLFWPGIGIAIIALLLFTFYRRWRGRRI